MPVICCKTARMTPIASTSLMPGWKSWPIEPVSWAIAARIWATSSSACCEPPTRVRTRSASSARFFADEPARAFGHEKQQQQEQARRQNARAEHPPPAVFHVPRVDAVAFQHLIELIGMVGDMIFSACSGVIASTCNVRCQRCAYPGSFRIPR